MGTYGYSKKMLIEELTGFLDEIEGDFTKEDLEEALEFIKDYGFTINSTKTDQSLWKRKLKEETATSGCNTMDKESLKELGRERAINKLLIDMEDSNEKYFLSIREFYKLIDGISLKGEEAKKND